MSLGLEMDLEKALGGLLGEASYPAAEALELVAVALEHSARGRCDPSLHGGRCKAAQAVRQAARSLPPFDGGVA
jgi:hypothetical protein